MFFPRIGKALMDESFEQQVLMPSFTIDGNYSELARIKNDIASVFASRE